VGSETRATTPGGTSVSSRRVRFGTSANVTSRPSGTNTSQARLCARSARSSSTVAVPRSTARARIGVSRRDARTAAARNAVVKRAALPFT
jgi:hypothetical protein